jgi:hypothetical protein
VGERDDLEGVAVRGPSRRVQPADVPGQQRDELRTQLAELFRRREEDRLDGPGDVSYFLGIPGAGQLEAADGGHEPLEERLRQGRGRPGERRVLRVLVEGEPGGHQPPRPLSPVPAAGLLDEAEPGEHPQVIGARGRALADHPARLRRGHRPSQSDRLKQREPGRVR